MSTEVVPQSEREEISKIRKIQDEIYGDIDRFTVLVILTHMHSSSMHVDKILNLQRQITKNITEQHVIALLDELADRGSFP